MKSQTQFISYLLASSLFFLNMSCSGHQNAEPNQINVKVFSQKLPGFYATAASEQNVQFDAIFQSRYTSLQEVQSLSETDIGNLKKYSIFPTLKYLFGPLTLRSIGGEQKGSDVILHIEQAYLDKGFVHIPYTYNAQWLISKEFANVQTLQIPVPYNNEAVLSKNWKKCTDNSSEEHQNEDMYWYFWDPERSGCDHKEGIEYQIVTVQLGTKTVPTVTSYPEYQNMIQQNVVNMTFAFGYVKDVANSDPFTSRDPGMLEFHKFLGYMNALGKAANIKITEKPITEEKYFHVFDKNKIIGTEFIFEKNNVVYHIKVVTSTEIDQMELFTVSFAKEHDAFFGWFGHSRVGNGFDADQFNRLLRQFSARLTVSANYQMIYWAGCNSYSYYTKPFFNFKKNLIQNDISGTKSLDIISNGLPSLFSLNALNAKVLLETLTSPESNLSYQEIVNKIESQSSRYGISVFVNILGDEDNN